MASPPDRGRRLGVSLEVWNRRVHYYLGLYLLLFVWVFSFTGLLLNHLRWTLSRIPYEPSPVFDRTIESPSGDTDLARAADVARQLHVRGEIEWRQATGLRQAGLQHRLSEASDSSTGQPGSQSRDRSAGGSQFLVGPADCAHVQRLALQQPGTSRDWPLTSVWVAAMDALACGLLVTVIRSYYTWYRMKSKRTVGAVALSAGCLSCGLFVLGFAWGAWVLRSASISPGCLRLKRLVCDSFQQPRGLSRRRSVQRLISRVERSLHLSPPLGEIGDCRPTAASICCALNVYRLQFRFVATGSQRAERHAHHCPVFASTLNRTALAILNVSAAPVDRVRGPMFCRILNEVTRITYVLLWWRGVEKHQA